MQMTAEWVTAGASVFTCLVIAASAIAALVQLRHMRGGNQIVALTEYRETLESPAFREAQHFVSFVLPERLRDAIEARKVASMNPFVGDYEAIATVGNFFENMGVFVKNGIIDKTIACDCWSFVIVRNWRALAPVVEVVRRRTSATAYVYFEYLAAVAAKHNETNATSKLRGRFRMPQDTSLADSLNETKAEPSTP
jgi:Domain of unknown function (DUF4760)